MSTDPITLLAGLASFGKTVADIAASDSAAERNSLLIEFQKALIQSQSLIATEQIKNATLVSRNQELEQQIMSFKNWEAEAEKYALKEIIPGVVAQVEKNFVGRLQSAHKFCASCFDKRIKSPLQQSKVDHRNSNLCCHSCNSKVLFVHYADET